MITWQHHSMTIFIMALDMKPTSIVGKLFEEMAKTTPRGRPGAGVGIGVRRMDLCEAASDVHDALLVVIIIGKGRTFKVNRASGDGSSASGCTFTIRDHRYTANCTLWGSEAGIARLHDAFQIADIVDIVRPRFKARNVGNRNERFVPEVSLPYDVIVDENSSEMRMHDGEDGAALLPLLKIPTKPPRGYHALADLFNEEIRDDFVDLLVIVTEVLPARDVRTRNGEIITRREVLVSDRSVDADFGIVLWDGDAIRRSSSWTRRETVLFIADIRLQRNDRFGHPKGSVTGRTLITEDPDVDEAETLRLHFQHAPERPSRNVVGFDFPDVSSIKNAMTARQIMDRVNSATEYTQFTAILYAIITDFDLDGPRRNVIAKCKRCLGVVRSSGSICENRDCGGTAEVEYEYDVRMSLSDYSGTLNNCHLVGAYAQQTLNHMAEDFTNLSPEDKGQIKWKWLLERVAVKVVVSKGPIIHIVSCGPADLSDLSTKLPIY